MAIGNNLKKLRVNKGMTQKDLADSLNVSSQAVSRWENDEVEPDISTLSKLSSIFEVPVDAIINGNFEKKEEPADNTAEVAAVAATVAAVAKTKEDTHICEACAPKPTTTSAPASATPPTSNPIIDPNRVVGTCAACGKTLHVCDHYKEVNVPAGTTHHRGHTSHHGAYTKYYCEKCYALREKGKLNYDGSAPKMGKKRLIFGLIFGIAVLIGSMIGFLAGTNMSVAAGIFLPVLLGYGVFAEIYCLFTDCYIGDVFMEVASWSIKFPGIIFSFDLDGLAFLIVMKILFAIIGFFIGVAVFLLAVVLSTFLSLFTFPFVAHHEGV